MPEPLHPWGPSGSIILIFHSHIHPNTPGTYPVSSIEVCMGIKYWCVLLFKKFDTPKNRAQYDTYKTLIVDMYRQYCIDSGMSHYGYPMGLTGIVASWHNGMACQSRRMNAKL